jgi:CHAD domain-containing protein
VTAEALDAPPGLSAVEVPTLEQDATLAELVRAGLLANVAVLVEHEPVAVLDQDPEGVHQARVGIRRTRSNLRTFRDVLEPAWRVPLDAELKRQAALLGHVRDADVLGQRLRRAIEDLPGRDQLPALGLLDRLAEQRAQAFAELHAELTSPAHGDFIARLLTTVDQPVFVSGAEDGAGALIGRPAVDVVGPLVAKPWRKLRKAVRRLPPSDEVTHEELHQVRIKAKRARYACDAVKPLIGKPAKQLASRLGDLQDVLGDLHDTSVAEDWLRAAASDVRVARSGAVAAGVLVARERADGADLEAQWPAAWKRVRASDTGWMT